MATNISTVESRFNSRAPHHVCRLFEGCEKPSGPAAEKNKSLRHIFHAKNMACVGALHCGSVTRICFSMRCHWGLAQISLCTSCMELHESGPGGWNRLLFSAHCSSYCQSPFTPQAVKHMFHQLRKLGVAYMVSSRVLTDFKVARWNESSSSSVTWCSGCRLCRQVAIGCAPIMGSR